MVAASRKRRYSRLGIFFILLVAMGSIAIGFVLMGDVPAPQKTIEKELDAKAFLAPAAQPQ